jgi:hypothetical protein
MKFLLIMNMNPAVWNALTEEERTEVMEGHGAFMDEITKSGEMVMTQALADPSQSSVVRVRDGRPVVTDGPFLESKEYLGGFTIVDSADLDAALAWGARITTITGLPIEVRPFMEQR